MSLLRKHPQWPLVKEILLSLHHQGHKAFLAGGCVRDLLMHKMAEDLDIATSAPPEVVEGLFPKTLDIGKIFGTIVVVSGEQQVEVTTFRKDGPYEDGRHPKFVEYSSEKEDASRRDFTINSMYFDPFSKKLIDYFCGQQDLKSKIIRTVGSPRKRFDEDKLRLLRALRFASQLDFRIEDKTYAAICDLAHEIKVVSKERIVHEMKKLSSGMAAARSWELLVQSRLWSNLNQVKIVRNPPRKNDYIEFGAHDLFTFYVFMTYWHKINDNFDLLSVVKNWPFSKSFKINLHRTIDIFKVLKSEERFYNKAKVFNEALGLVALKLWKFDVRADHQQFKDLELFVQKFLEICNGQGHLPKALVKGSDLVEYGYTPGPQFAQWLDKAYELQLSNPLFSKNDIIKSLS